MGSPGSFSGAMRACQVSESGIPTKTASQPSQGPPTTGTRSCPAGGLAGALLRGLDADEAPEDDQAGQGAEPPEPVEKEATSVAS